MASKARSYRRARQTTVPLMIVGGFVPLGIRAYQGFTGNGIVGALDGISSGVTGFSIFDKKWHPEVMAECLLPVAAGFVLHGVANRLGINRALGRYRIPFIRF